MDFLFDFIPSAQAAVPFTPYITGIACAEGADFLPCYFNELYKFAVQAAIVFAVMMITIGGMQWLIAIGNPSKISNAKATISGAIIGLLLALTAYVLLSQINANLVNLKIDYVDKVSLTAPAQAGASLCGEEVRQPIKIKDLDMVKNGGISDEQFNYAHRDLTTAIVKLNDEAHKLTDKIEYIRVTSIIHDNVFNGSCTRDAEGNLNDKKKCEHGSASAHFGGNIYNCAFNKEHPPISCAADLGYKSKSSGWKIGIVKAGASWQDILKAARAAGMKAFCESTTGKDQGDDCDVNTDHVHAYVLACG